MQTLRLCQRRKMRLLDMKLKKGPSSQLRSQNEPYATFLVSVLFFVKRGQALRANRDPKAQEDLNNKMAEATVNEEALEVGASSSGIARNIPPHNVSATIPQQAYPLEKIIFKGEWEYLRDIVELLQQGRDVARNAYPVFVCNRVHKIEEVKIQKGWLTTKGIF